MDSPRMIVFSTLFPHAGQPNAGLFIRERMFRVSANIPLVVVAPLPWFPLQGLIRRFRPHFRPEAPAVEEQQGVQVWHPRFFCIPGIFKWLDGLFLALGSYRTVKRLCTEHDIRVIDSHFGYPDGYAATLLGRWLQRPVSITLRGTEIRHGRTPTLRPLLARALARAQQIITVSTSLKEHAVSIGADSRKVTVVGNGVDIRRFQPVDRAQARQTLGLDEDARVMISVGGLVERKGFHRVIPLLPGLLKRHPNLIYLVVGGPSAEGDMRLQLERQVRDLGLEERVRFLGPITPDELKIPLSAADLFVLATANEGWANVFLEAMACGLPVVTTDVGGNREVVCRDELGSVVPFGDEAALAAALDDALARDWDRASIIRYARDNSWDERVVRLTGMFNQLGASA